MKDFINVNVEDTKELSVRDAHLAVIDNLPKGFERVDFDKPAVLVKISDIACLSSWP